MFNFLRSNKRSVAQVRESMQQENTITERVNKRLVGELAKIEGRKFNRGFTDPMQETREDVFKPSSSEDFLQLYESYHNTFSCVDAICRNAASVPQRLYKLEKKSEEKDERGEEVTDGEVWELLYKPNPHEDNYNFRYSLLANLCLTGNAYIEKAGGAAMLPDQLWLLRPDWMRILLDAQTMIKGYEYTVDGITQDFDVDRVMRFKLFHPRSELYGMSPLNPAQNSIIIDLYCIKYAKQFFKQGGHIDWYLKVKDSLETKDFDRLDQQLQSYFGGLEKAHKPRVLDNDAELVEVGSDPDKVALISQREKATKENSQIWGVPALMLGLPNETHYNNADAQIKVFLEQTIMPKNKIVDFVFNRDLFYPLGYEVVSDYSGYDVLQLKMKDKAMTGKFLIESKVMNPNEVREMLWDLEEYDGGDVFPEKQPTGIQANKSGAVTLDQVVKLITLIAGGNNNKPIIVKADDGRIEPIEKTNETKKKLEEIKKASISSIEALRKFILPHYEKAAKDIQKGLMNNVIASIRSLKKSVLIVKDDFVDGVLKNMDKETKNMIKDLLKVKRDILDETIKREYKRIKKAPIPPAELKSLKADMDSRLTRLAEDASANITETAKNRVKGHLKTSIGLNENIQEMTKKMQELFEGTPKGGFTWGRTIARTETAKFSNFTRFETMNKLGYEKKQWFHSGHADARDSHLAADTEIKKINEPFSMGLMFPGDPSGGPEEVINCGCTVAEYVAPV